MLTTIESRGGLGFMTYTPDGPHPTDGSQAEQAYREMDDLLRRNSSVVLQERVFGHLDSAPLLAESRERAVGSTNTAWAVPPTYVEGAPAKGRGLGGIHVVTARAARSELLTRGGRAIGRSVELAGVRLAGLSDVGREPGDLRTDAAEDAARTIEVAEALLRSAGFSFDNVFRTWFYLREILGWYDSFNRVRNIAFERLGLVGPGANGAIPASTGIEGRNARGGWCTLDLLAAQPRGNGLFVRKRLHSAKQNEATAYGSSFARGMELRLGGSRYLFVSGTASIDEAGASVHSEDLEAQTRHTVGAVAALLGGAGATVRDICQATVFVKDPDFVSVFERAAGGMGFSAVPKVLAVADVCRGELLVEIDAVALVSDSAEP